MSPTNLNRLKELAEAATPGPWSYEPDDEGCSMGWIVSPCEMLAKIAGDSAQQAANAAYIAAASPQVVLGMIAERDEMVEAAKDVLARWDSPQWKWDESSAALMARLRAAVAKLEEQGL